MALETISLSDIGQSLVAIEQEIHSNNSLIDMYKRNIGELQDKNDRLVALSRELFKLNCPLSYHYSCKDLY